MTAAYVATRTAVSKPVGDRPADEPVDLEQVVAQDRDADGDREEAEREADRDVRDLVVGPRPEQHAVGDHDGRDRDGRQGDPLQLCPLDGTAAPVPPDERQRGDTATNTSITM